MNSPANLHPETITVYRAIWGRMSPVKSRGYASFEGVPDSELLREGVLVRNHYAESRGQVPTEAELARLRQQYETHTRLPVFINRDQAVNALGRGKFPGDKPLLIEITLPLSLLTGPESPISLEMNNRSGQLVYTADLDKLRALAVEPQEEREEFRIVSNGRPRREFRSLLEEHTTFFRPARLDESHRIVIEDGFREHIPVPEVVEGMGEITIS